MFSLPGTTFHTEQTQQAWLSPVLSMWKSGRLCLSLGCRKGHFLVILPSLLQCFILQKGFLGLDPKKGKKKNVSGGKMPNLSLLEFCSTSFLFPNFQSFTPESFLHFAWAELFSPALNSWNSLWLCWLAMLNTRGVTTVMSGKSSHSEQSPVMWSTLPRIPMETGLTEDDQPWALTDSCLQSILYNLPVLSLWCWWV